jgi:hypothetical protein
MHTNKNGFEGSSFSIELCYLHVTLIADPEGVGDLHIHTHTHVHTEKEKREEKKEPAGVLSVCMYVCVCVCVYLWCVNA